MVEYEHALANDDIAKNAAGYLFFADYMIWCMAWAISCLPGENYGRIIVISETERFVANSFGDFVDAYIRDHGELL